MSDKFGLVLSGGGARGAYQVGVIQALSSLFADWGLAQPFSIYSGVSAGSINASLLASTTDDFGDGSKRLVDLWSTLESKHVFHTDAMSLGKIGLQWMGELSFGSLTGGTPGKALLDTSPLRSLIEKNLDSARLQRNLEKKSLEALAITCLDYRDSTAVTFVQGQEGLPSWQKPRKVSERAEIKTDHVLASSAIPLLFPPVQVDSRFFGDGCVRNTHPCGPAIYLGAQRLVIIGVRTQNVTAYDAHGLFDKRAPSTARVLNVLLNSVLLDGIDLDVERIRKVNEMVAWIPPERYGHVPYKKVEYVWICPSRDIGQIAARKSKYLPKLIRFLIKNLGSLEEASEIVSYLLFEKEFTNELIEMGFEDGMAAKEALQKLYDL
ncbi:MAG: patatin-like phospholipase family protein [Bdellovibrionales bacterium]